MYRNVRHKSVKQKVPEDRKRKKVKDSSKSFIKNLSEELGTSEKWQELGLRIGFTQSQMTQIETSYSDDQSFCAQVMLKDWHNIAKEFLEQPEAHIREILRRIPKDSHAACHQPKLDVDQGSYLCDAMIRAIQAISFGPTTEKSVTHAAYNITNCSNVMIGTGNTMITEGSDTDTTPTESPSPKDPEETIVRSLETIIERRPGKSNKLNLQKLESEFQDILVAQNIDKPTFQSFTGKTLIKFLKEHKDRFELNLVGSQYSVKSITKPAMPKVIPIKTPQSTPTESTPTPNVCIESDSDDGDMVDTENKVVESKTIVTDVGCSKVKSYAAAVAISDKTPTPATMSRQTPKNSSNMSGASNPDDMKDVHSDPRDLIEFVKNFAGGHYVLFVCFREKMKYLDCLGLVPWLAVFDFDEESRSTGLLTVLEERVKKRRALYTCTWKDSAKFSDYCTEWCMIRGSVQEAGSKTPRDSREWFRTVKANLDQHFKAMAVFTETYTTVKCIIVLPEDEETLQCMHKAMLKLEEHIEPAPTVIVCDPQMITRVSTPWIYKAMHVDFKLRCNFQEFCKALSHTSLVDDLKQMKTIYRLPTSDDTNNPGFDESFVSSLRENLEVLYLDYPRSRPVDLDELKEEGDKFLKGGTLRWFAYYECNAGHFDAERDIMESIVKRVKEKFLEPFRSGVIKLYHAPGSGGTTLMQRVLWELRKLSPCAQVKIHPTISVQDLAHDLESLFEKTHLPLVLLIDGGEDKLSKQLSKLLGHVSIVILQVKRYPHHISMTEHPNNKFFLKGQVSEKEASGISMKFMEKCDNDAKKDSLQQLVEDVHQGNHHSVYEFGLTTFLEEYHGIASYVRGYLQLESNPTKNLEPWQEILGFLSMAYYYGQTSMPCQYFAAMLGKQPNYDVDLSDFPHFVQELVVPCEGRKNNIRICHYIIAKGILDQILTWPQTYDEPTTEIGLSIHAKSKLVNFANRFIEESKKKTGRTSTRTNTVIETLSRTFLHRDYKDVGEGEISMRKRTFSTLLEDIPCKPPYTERIKVIQKLVNAFPENPNFRAHLGRIYTICQPDEEEIARQCFEKALELCQKETKGKQIDDINEGMKITLMHIYHMYGMHYLRCVDRFTGRFGEKPVKKTSKDQYPSRIEYIITMATCACGHFTKRREITPTGSEEGYGYIGEITVRLLVCNFIAKNFPKGTSNFGEYLQMAEGTSPGQFVIESITEIAELFMECYSAVDGSELDQEYFRNINMYNTLFNNHIPTLGYISKPEDISARCFRAAAIKLKYGKDDNLGVLQKITSKVDIEELVKIYEDCFEEILSAGIIDKRRVLEMCYKEWIHAIRHGLFPQNYKQDDVLLKIRQWNRFLQSPMSKFYLFCTLSIIGIGTDGTRGNVDHLQEAIEIREELQKMYFPKPRLPREWLGKGDGIKALVPVSGFLGQIEERNVKGESNMSRLAFLKGTICRPNRLRQTGFIDLDLGENLCKLKVFFVPIRTEGKLFGQSYAGERVEFTLTFTTTNGYEAYNVSLLKKILCTDCDSYLEIKSDEVFTTYSICHFNTL
ncbi:uncharacterized protein LOC117344560 [Pecten maximus]|uniref:uncharacterized protein LOC117344560 n=1 Tax=Pecten maximus TaxID=6579 RepID=UPI001458994D|nr:uncharacterized protein LOC117344560 [Pecten maximus]